MLPSPLRVSALALLASLAVGAFGCASTSAGPTVRRNVPTSEGFSALEVDDLDVVAHVGFAHRVSLRCHPDRAPYARVTVVGETLRAELKGEPVRVFGFGDMPCVVDVYLPALRSVRIEGSGDVRVIGSAEGLQSVALEGSGDARFDDAKGEATRFEVTGSGDLHLRRLEAQRAEFSVTGSGDVEVVGGVVTAARFTCSGSGDVNAAALVAEKAEVRTSGSGDVHMTARQSAEVDVSGSGDVVIVGDPPACRAKSSGSGSASCR